MKTHNRHWGMLLAPLCASILLAACGGNGGGGSAPIPGAVVTLPDTSGNINGTAATGAAIANSTIHVMNAAGEDFQAQSGADGTFNINVQGFGPYLLYTDTPTGRLYGYSDTIARANINQLTDAIVRAARPANHLAGSGGFNLINGQYGSILPALDLLVGDDGVLNTADDKVRIKGLENRKLLACVQDPGASGSDAQKQAYTTYMTDESSTMPASDFVSCWGANSEAYMTAVYTNYVDLTWKSRSQEYASNMAAAKSLVISSLGVQRIQDLTAATQAVDLSAIDPMKVEFVAGTGQGFDGLLDRMVVNNKCDTSNNCAASVVLYADIGKSSLAPVPQLIIDGVASRTPSYCAAGSELSLQVAPMNYNGAAPGNWAVEFSVEQNLMMPLGTSVVSKIVRCPAADTVLMYQGGDVSALASYNRLPVITSKAQMQANQPLSCNDFPIGLQSTSLFTYLNKDQVVLPLSLDQFGAVEGCTEFSSDKEGGAGSYGLKVNVGVQTLVVTYHQVP